MLWEEWVGGRVGERWGKQEEGREMELGFECKMRQNCFKNK